MTRFSTNTKENVQETRVRRSRRVSYKPIVALISSDSEDEILEYTPMCKQTTPKKQKLKKQNDQENNEVTPSKQKKKAGSDSEHSTPPTPSTLLDKLALVSPQKPLATERKSKFERKKLFPGTNLYQNARKALHSSLPTTLPGRENELEELNTFISSHINEEQSGTLYVSGPPGTGKTASLSIILQQENVSLNTNVDCGFESNGFFIYSDCFKVPTNLRELYRH